VNSWRRYSRGRVVIERDDGSIASRPTKIPLRLRGWLPLDLPNKRVLEDSRLQEVSTPRELMELLLDCLSEDSPSAENVRRAMAQENEAVAITNLFRALLITDREREISIAQRKGRGKRKDNDAWPFIDACEDLRIKRLKDGKEFPTATWLVKETAKQPDKPRNPDPKFSTAAMKAYRSWLKKEKKRM
jgi:hypothetical protein